MQALTATPIVFLFIITAATAQKSPATHPYDDADAYEIYSLLLPYEESYGFAEATLLIQENTVDNDISGACLTQVDAAKFKGVIAGYRRIYKEKWVLQRRFEMGKLYRLVAPTAISALPDRPQSAVSYVRMSPVGFNRKKTQAVVFVESSCGGLCGHSQFHFLQKSHGKWSEIPVAMCVVDSLLAKNRHFTTTHSGCQIASSWCNRPFSTVRQHGKRKMLV